MVEVEEDEQPRSSLFGGVFNLTNTALGGGISFISLPLAAKKAGVLLLPGIECVSFIGNSFTCYLLVHMSIASGEQTFAALGQRFLGRWALIVPCLIVGNNLGICVAFLETFADVIPPLFHCDGFCGVVTSRTLLLVITSSCLLVPVLAVRSMSGFVVASLLSSTGAVLFVTYGIVLSAAEEPKGEEEMDLGVSSPFDLLSALSIISLSWTCQFNVLPIFNTIEKPTSSRMLRVIVTSMGIACAAYTAFGFAAYNRYRETTTGDTLIDFDDTQVGQVLRVVVVLALVMTFPLFIFEISHNFEIVLLALFPQLFLPPLSPLEQDAPLGQDEPLSILAESDPSVKCAVNEEPALPVTDSLPQVTLSAQSGVEDHDGLSETVRDMQKEVNKLRSSLPRCSSLPAFPTDPDALKASDLGKPGGFRRNFLLNEADKLELRNGKVAFRPAAWSKNFKIPVKKHRKGVVVNFFGSFTRSFYNESFYSSEDDGFGSEYNFFENEERAPRPSRCRRRWIGAGMTVTACLISIAVKDVSTVIDLVAAMCGMPIGYIIPTSLFLISRKVLKREKQGGLMGGDDESISQSLMHLEQEEQSDRMMVIGAWTILILGSVSTAACIANAIRGFA